MFIDNEAIDLMLKSNNSRVLCKLAIEKVHAHVNWDLLLAVLNKMGFGQRWISWISWCISSPKFSVVVNDTLFGFFQSSRGVR